MKNIVNILLALTFLLFGACSGSRQADKTPLPMPAFDKGQTWQLTVMRGRPVDPKGYVFTLIFNPEAGSVSGMMACNEYFGLYSCLPGDPGSQRYPIKIELQGSGSLLCTEADMNAEARYYALLMKTTHLAYTPTAITLYQNNKEILRYELQ